jgi:ATPase subunit of ABC transporter with duplicated ATPase domains
MFDLCTLCIDKSIKALSGGEKGRMLFGKLMLQNPNVLVMDEPTNHLDMESIEALNLALENYEGNFILPLSASSSPTSVRNSVVLPTPFCPIMATR